MNINKLPDRFEIDKVGNVWIIMNKDYQNIIKYIVENRTHLEVIHHTPGRGGISLIKINRMGIKNVVIKHYYRGGLAAFVLFKDLFLWSQRPISELIATEQARVRGVLVPEILGLVIRRVLGLFYRAEIILEEIPNSQNLNEVFSDLCTQSSSPEALKDTKLKLIKAIAKAIKLLHEAGIYHHDLNLRNILIQKIFDNILKIYIIDFDKAEYFDDLPFKRRMQNLIRLNRSIEKGGWSGKIIDTSDRLRLVNDYLKGEEINRSQRYWFLQKCQRELILHRYWWKIMGR